MNLLGMLFFWFVTMNMDCYDSKKEMRTFLEKNKQLTCGMKEEEEERLLGHLKRIFQRLPMCWNLHSSWRFLSRRKVDEQTPSSVLSLLAQPHGKDSWLPLSATIEEIVEVFEKANREKILQSLAVLEKRGVITRFETVRAGNRLYTLTSGNEEKAGEIRRILIEREISAEEATLLRWKTEQLDITDISWAEYLRELIVDGVWVKRMIDAEEKPVMCIEIDWFPADQMAFARKLVEQIATMANVTVVTGPAPDIVFELTKTALKRGGQWRNVTVLASRDTIYSRNFLRVRKFMDIGYQAFFAAVDPKNLRNDSYVPLTSMLSMAVEATRYWWEPRHSGMDIWETGNSRTCIFEPRAVPIFFRFSHEAHAKGIQIDVGHAAYQGFPIIHNHALGSFRTEEAFSTVAFVVKA